MSHYVIGDLQGCFEPLQRLLERLNFDPAADQLWFAGDLVNRGPESLQVLRFLRGLGTTAVSVLGNHDLHLLARASGGRAGRRDTLDALLAAPDRQELLDWLRHRPLMHEHEGWLLLHAGLPPQWNLAQARRAARQVEAILRGPDHARFLSSMYGDEPALWSPGLRGNRRHRFIVNAFTRLRYCDADGRMDLRPKGAPGSQPEGLMPWFAVPGRASRNAEILFGHWSTLGQVHWPEHRVWGLDTGAVWGGRLTALCLETRRLIQVECPEFRRPAAEDAD